ncbi:P-selectin [Strongylocentrotus purpuratus]|uniref:Sushi domain-containing protein n=1 Tax=Strongylocentrotus purpuratus TaxID=7668 RepID=A0A7M7GM87_STRPU|nr:P-selectin [Strongylocentrotus purpuratus]
MEAHFRICFLFVVFGFLGVNAQVCDISALSIDPMLLIDGVTPVGPYSAYTLIFFTCTSTYMSNLPEFNMCQGSDTWMTSPEDYTCSAPCSADEWSSFTATVTSGQYITTDNAYEHNTVISLSCAEGSIEGSDIITCQDGSWIPSRQSIRCNLCGTTGLSLAPMLLIDDVIPAPSYPIFDLISVSCQTTYMSKFGNFNMCLESGWITPLQDYECLAPCDPGTWSSVDASVIIGQYFASNNVYEHNTILEFSCSAGSLEGPAITACQNGAWSPATDSVQCKQPCDSRSLLSRQELTITVMLLTLPVCTHLIHFHQLLV